MWSTASFSPYAFVKPRTDSAAADGAGSDGAGPDGAAPVELMLLTPHHHTRQVCYSESMFALTTSKPAGRKEVVGVSHADRA